jgi:hypothetical protein
VELMLDSALIFRRAMHARASGNWQREYDVLDGDRKVGRIYLVDIHGQTWFWGVSLQLTGRNSYGHVGSLEEAKVAFRAAYEAWPATNDPNNP